ncbi:hypothetical protein IFM89_022566 [Coptis chinensis]|uniref:Bifunctional inhibitor/plant lipid transfer protein/seed storage helical domain-containing protein n=1 Tax=Coptis chinensis TaxID=261450 RepID=A0A835H7Z5_9MAGN|nr:hypothetical protein IFM89_022566 [Coptis chinensis]
MNSKSHASTAALFFSLNFLFFAIGTATTQPTCRIEVLQLGVCLNFLGGVVVSPPYPCCTLMEGLADFDAAVCLCLAIKSNVMGTNLDIAQALDLIFKFCRKNLPSGFECA